MTITATFDSGTYTDTPSDTWDVLVTTNPTTADGVFVFKFDLSNLVAGETFEVRIQEKNAAGTLKPGIGPISFTGVQTVTQPSIRFIATKDWTVEARQRTGTGRAVAWWIDQVT